jgi:hypothetical protein
MACSGVPRRLERPSAPRKIHAFKGSKQGLESGFLQAAETAFASLENP